MGRMKLPSCSCTCGIDATRQRCTLLLLPAGQSKTTPGIAAMQLPAKVIMTGTAAFEQAQKEGPSRNLVDCTVVARFTEMWGLTLTTSG